MIGCIILFTSSSVSVSCLLLLSIAFTGVIIDLPAYVKTLPLLSTKLRSPSSSSCSSSPRGKVPESTSLRIVCNLLSGEFVRNPLSFLNKIVL